MSLATTHFIIYSQFASPGEAIKLNVQAKDGYSHNTTAFLELKV